MTSAKIAGNVEVNCSICIDEISGTIAALRDQDTGTVTNARYYE